VSARISDLEHELKGTRPSRATAEKESHFTAGRPKCPAHFNDEKRRKWKEVVRLFAARRVLTKADAPAIELYVETYFRHLALLRELEAHGELVTEVDSKGNERRVANPAGKLATACENSLRQMIREFGGTPLTREKSKPAKKAEPRQEEFAPGTVGWILKQRGEDFLLKDKPDAEADLDEEEESED
jgi:P27 family predicted phage terminase small subunit